MAQPYAAHPGGLPQHAGGPHGHPMAPGHPSNQGQPGGGQAPGQGITQQVHSGVSGPGGPQGSQAGAMVGGMPPGSGPGGPSAHALSHLNPNPTQQQVFQHQQQQQMAQASKSIFSEVRALWCPYFQGLILPSPNLYSSLLFVLPKAFCVLGG